MNRNGSWRFVEKKQSCIPFHFCPTLSPVAKQTTINFCTNSPQKSGARGTGHSKPQKKKVSMKIATKGRKQQLGTINGSRSHSELPATSRAVPPVYGEQKMQCHAVSNTNHHQLQAIDLLDPSLTRLRHQHPRRHVLPDSPFPPQPNNSQHQHQEQASLASETSPDCKTR